MFLGMRLSAWCVTIPMVVAALYGGDALAQTGAVDQAFRFQRGDGLRVQVWQRPELSGDFSIRPDGRLDHPLLQEVAVAGRSFPDVQQDVLTFLRQFQQTPRAVITPLFQIFVGGSLLQPKTVFVDPRTRVFDLVALGGGPASARRLNRVEIRKSTGVQRFDLQEAIAARELQSLGVRSGDQVMFMTPGSFWRDTFVPVMTVLGSTLGIAHFIWNVTR